MLPTPEKPPVSVVIPAYNTAAIFAETLESLRAQTFQNFEVIIVDDGSTDDTVAVARRFCEMDSRFLLIQQSNGGVSAARNTAIQRARGEWIAFLDCDDVWLPEKLACQMDLIRQDPRANLLFTNFTKWDGQRDFHLAYAKDKPLPEGDTILPLIFKCLYLPSTVMVRRQTLLDAGLFDTRQQPSEDWDVWLWIAEHGLWARGTREPLVRWRRWPGSNLIKTKYAYFEQSIRMLEKHIAAARRPDLLPFYHRSVIRVRASREISSAYQAVKTNPDAVLNFIGSALHYEWHWEWWWWFVFLKWPKLLGGRITRRKAHQKILKHVGSQKKYHSDSNELSIAMTSTPEKPTVSVVIPAFNCGKILAETLESVCAQTFKDFEVIIVDDGSTDDTAAVARRFCEKDSRFSLIQQSNGGVCAARNTAILRARGEWIAFLDHDDTWLPEKLARQMKLSHEDTRANLLFTNFTKWDGRRDFQLAYAPDEPLPEGDTIRKLIFKYTYLASAVAVRRQLLLDIGLFDRELNLVEDWDVWLRIAERGIHARGTREPFMRWRRWPGSNLVKNRLESVQKATRMLEKHIAAARRPDLLPLYHRSLAHLRAMCEMIGARAAVETDPDAVPEFVRRALRHERRWEWWWWFILLKWPKSFGGRVTRRNIHQKILKRWATRT